jgi:hypothetical protein
MSEPEKQAYAWNLPKTATLREVLAVALAADGTRHLRVKAGGDLGAVWIPGGRHPDSAGPQWDDGWLAHYTAKGIRVTPWFYVWPAEVDKEAIAKALNHRDADELALNAETEWRVSSPDNTFRSLAEANVYAEAWVRDLRTWLPHPVRIAFSSVPSWADFPYEGFAAACDQAEPQHYWPGALLAGGKDQVVRHLERAGGRLPCVPILTASGEYDLGGVVGLAADAIRECPDLAGFSTWECANAAYQHVAVRQAYALLGDLARREPLDFAAAWRAGGTFTERYRRWRAA